MKELGKTCMHERALEAQLVREEGQKGEGCEEEDKDILA